MSLNQAELPKPDYSHLTSIELLRNNIETERLEKIPLSQVITENALVDDSHADELAQSMSQKRGQITPIAVRARLSEDRQSVVYDILDGFHRSAGKKRSGQLDINATVIYGCSDEEMFDLRILAASSVRSVQFPRIAQWITNSFETTKWSEKGFSVSQAFGIATNDSDRVQKIKLTKDEITELKTWVKEKCDRWGKTIGSTYQILRLVANADPDLVRQVRAHSGGGKDRIGRVTPARLQAVVGGFPGIEFYGAQKAIMKHVINERFSADETTNLVNLIKPLIKPGVVEEKVTEIIGGIKLEQLERVLALRDANDLEDPQGDPDAADYEEPLGGWEDIEPSFDDLDKIETEEDVADVQSIIPATRRRGHLRLLGGLSDKEERQVKKFASGDTTNEDNLTARIKDLESSLELARLTAGSSDLWWRTSVYLTPIERACMEGTLGRLDSLDTVAEELRIPMHKAFQMIQSAYKKRQVSEQPSPEYPEELIREFQR